MAKKPKYQAEGKDYTPAKGFHDADLDFTLPGKPATPAPVAGAGEPISKAAFDELKRRYAAYKGINDTEHVTFSREAILSILAQYGCAGIKFYFVERMGTKTKQLTLAMAGVDENNNDLTNTESAKLSTAQPTLISDLGHGHPPTA
jgi:hypothetical protein